MDGNSLKKAPILDHLVDTSSTPTHKKSDLNSASQTVAKSFIAPMNSASTPAQSTQDSRPQTEKLPQNRRTDKSEFEIELTKTVHKIMLKHFEDASEEIVQQVLSEVRARLPGRRKN